MMLVSYRPINQIVLVGLLVMVTHFLHAGSKCATLPGTEESMTTTIEFITALFCQVDEQIGAIPKHPEALLWPSEVVTLGLLHALKGVGNRPFYRWLTRDYRALCPRLGCRTFLSCISKGFGSFCSRLLRLRTGKLSSAFRLHGFTHIF
jgi:hypothetical protein